MISALYALTIFPDVDMASKDADLDGSPDNTTFVFELSPESMMISFTSEADKLGT